MTGGLLLDAAAQSERNVSYEVLEDKSEVDKSRKLVEEDNMETD